MDELAKEEFKRDFIIKTLVQQTQFEQWLRYFFFLNNELIEKCDFVYQDAFYIKFYELFTKGLVYANKVLERLQKGHNTNKFEWYVKLIDGLNNIMSELTEEEFEYIEYRRHNSCHIFQNRYEHIQENLGIKKDRNGKKLQDINASLKRVISKHGSDKNIDTFINSKLQHKLTDLHRVLTEIYNKVHQKSENL